MKHEKISIKWKIFFYLLVFTGILLTVLWLVQICYLDKFYKKIKSQEALELTSEVIAVLQSDSQNIEEQIDALAAQNNMIVFVTDTDGNTIYSAGIYPEFQAVRDAAGDDTEAVRSCQKQGREHEAGI